MEIENGNCIIPEGVTKIGNMCFYNCSLLTNITLSSSLKEIGDGVFSNTKITTIIIPEGVTKIGNYCFSNCSLLTNITLPSSLKETGDYALFKTKITTIQIPEGITKFECLVPMYTKEILNKQGIECPNCYTDPEDVIRGTIKIESGNCLIPEGVIKIGDNCFECCSQLTNITLPSSLKEIGEYAFFNTNINTIKIPEGVTKIGNKCFWKCSQLTNITLPSTLKEIGDDAFSNSNITSIIIPKSCKYVENGWSKSFPDNCKIILN